MPIRSVEHLVIEALKFGEDPMEFAVRQNLMKEFLEMERRRMWYDKRVCLIAACQEGMIEFIKLFLERGAKLDPEILGAAAWGGEETMQAVFDMGCGMDEFTFEEAARSTVYQSLRWLINKGCPMTSKAFYAVLEEEFHISPRDECFELLLVSKCPIDKSLPEYLYAKKEIGLLMKMQKVLSSRVYKKKNQ